MIKRENIDVRLMKIILVVILILGVIIDAVLAINPDWPTFSRIARDSSPLFLILIWLYGIATGNIFFQREVSQEDYRKIPIGRNFGIFIITGIVLIFIGILFHDCIEELACVNGTISTPSSNNIFVENVYFSSEKSISPNRDFYTEESITCTTINPLNKYWFKKDLSYLSKILIYILGILMVIYLWPRAQIKPKLKKQE